MTGQVTAPSRMTRTTPAERARVGWLAAFVLAVVVGHHVGTLLKPLGSAGRHVEWADLVDLLVPYAVVGSALAALRAWGAPRRSWLLAAVGGVVYVQGHGVHLAANSIGNARGNAQPVYLWDEAVGHYLWYVGLYLLVLALGTAAPALTSSWRWPLAALFGLTSATNGIEGGTAVLTLVVSLAFVGWGLRRRSDALVAAWTLTAVLLTGWGVYWQRFPQFSELGWI